MRLTRRLFSSVKQKRPYFITTPIFYVNSSPHLGHLYSAVIADTIHRFQKLTNPDYEILLSTGTDEHGTKIQQAAIKSNLDLPTYCSRISEEYRNLFRDIDVGFTDYIRTTEERHKKAVYHFWNKLMSKDYIYKSSYSGWYSVNDESFVPESHTKEEMRNGKNVKVSLESGHILEWTEEDNYMFRLSAFKSYLRDWLKKDGVITPYKFQKQLSDVIENEVYLPDISVSRPSSRVHWALKVPNDDSQSIYVWLDALINYLTVTGYPDDEEMKRRGRPWPADVQVIGKDILKFHGLYWPAFLMAVNWHPPRRLLCHSHWTVDGQKMSKSLQNVVDPRTTPGGLEALRYFLLREGTMHSDANYSTTKLIRTLNAELADTLGNLVSRCSAAALNPRSEYPAGNSKVLPTVERDALCKALDRLPDTCYEHYTNYQFYKVVDAVIQSLHLANVYFESMRPWDLKKRMDSQQDLDMILHTTMEALRVCSIILQPIIPSMSKRILDKLRVPVDSRSWQHCEETSWRTAGVIHENRSISNDKLVLFQRIYVDKPKKAQVSAN